MAIQRIPGELLQSNLTRQGVDLAFETNLLFLDVSNARIGIGTDSPNSKLDIAGEVRIRSSNSYITHFNYQDNGYNYISQANNIYTNIQYKYRINKERQKRIKSNNAIKKLRAEGFENLRVFSPVPNHEIEDALDTGKEPSKVKYFTFCGAILGALVGVCFTVLTSLDWPIVTSAKPIVSIPPYMIIIFECMILIGGLSTFLGLLINSLYYIKFMFLI